MSIGRPTKRQDVEAHFCKDGEKLKDLLIDLHHKQKKSLVDMSDALTDKEAGVSASPATIANWMEFFDIPTRREVPEASNALQKTVNDESKTPVRSDFDPTLRGFKCTKMCPVFDCCKYRDEYTGQRCPITADKREKVVKPIKELVRRRYENDAFALSHYMNVAELTGITWEILDRKLMYIYSEDVTQILNRPDPVTGELKQIKMPNLLNNEISKDQATLIRLLELLKVTPKTMDERKDDGDIATIVKLIEEAKAERAIKQKEIDENKKVKDSRPDIKTEKDFEKAMEEINEKQENTEKPNEKDVESAMAIEDMLGKEKKKSDN